MRKALVVYFQNYTDRAIVNLEKTVDEAFEIGGFLRNSLPKGYLFQVDVKQEPSARDVLVWLANTKKEFLEAEKANPGERNLIIFVFIGHGFERCDHEEFLLCADALDEYLETNTIGGISKATLDDFARGFANTDVVFWLDACRARLRRDKGRNKTYEFRRFRTVGDVAPERSTSRVLTICTCDKGEYAEDDGLTMRAVVDIMRERRQADEEIELGSTLTELWGERLNKKRRGNRQTPVAYGRPILLAPGVNQKESEEEPTKSRTSESSNSTKLEMFITFAVLGILAFFLGVGRGYFFNNKPSSQASNFPSVVDVSSQTNESDEETVSQSPNSTAEEPSSQASNFPPVVDVSSQINESAEETVSQSPKSTAEEPSSQTSNFPPVVDVSSQTNESASPVFEFDKEAFAQTEPGARATFKYNGVEYAFRYCPAGTFTMGSPESEKGRRDDETQHKVRLTKGFWMLETPVTQGLWTAVTGDNPSWFCATGGGSSEVQGMDTTNFPVEEVGWNDCQKFIEKLNQFAPEGMKFSLPTEAQWEYACRAGTTTPYSLGTSLNGDKANCDGRYPYGTSKEGAYLGRACAVKSYAPNPWGLYDLHGNVYEWCADWYGAYPSGSVVDPTGFTNASRRVVRGGGWHDYAKYCRSAYRDYCDPAHRHYFLGFRFLLE